MPLRLLGAGLCALCFTACGFVSSTSMRKRHQSILIAQDAIRLLEGQVVHMDVPLEEAIYALKGENAYWDRICRKNNALEENVWIEAADEMGLKKEDMEPLLRLRRAIPRQGRGDSSAFELCCRELTVRATSARTKWEREGALHKKLGALLGAAAFLLLC